MKIALLLLVAALAPQDPQDAAKAPSLTLRLKNGEVVRGELKSLQGDKAKLRVSIMGGHMVVTRRLDDFVPASVYRIELAAKPPGSFDEHLAMAQKAADYGLRPQAGVQARGAVEAAGDDKAKIQKVRAWAADAIEAMTRKAVAAGDLRDAQHCLKLLSTRLPDQRTEEQIAVIASAVEALEQKEKEARIAKRQARIDERERKEIARRLTPIEKRVEQGNKAYRDAIRKSRSTSASTKLCEKAIDNYKKGYGQLQKLVEKHPEDANLATVSASLAREMETNAIAAALHAANMRCVQSDYKGAMEWTQKVLRFDPDNAEAKEMNRTIQIAEAAASSDWRWGWRVVGGRPRYDHDR